MNEIKVPLEKVVHRRWVVLVGGFLLSLMGGMSYAWGSFVVPLVQDWGWTSAEANLPFTVMIIVFAIFMVPAGLIQDKIGPRKVATAGAFLFLLGYGMAGFLRFMPEPVWLIVSYGIIVGIACGLTYACIAPAARKWFPDRPGFAVSCGVMGFGLAAVIFAPLKKIMIDLWGVDGTFFILGIFVTVGAFIGARLISNPPLDWVCPSPKRMYAHQKSRPDAAIDIHPKKFIQTPMFYILWLALASVIGGGLTAIGLITAYGELELHLAPAKAALAISFYSFVNGLGRPFVGWFADRIGTIRVMIVVYTMQGIVFLSLPVVAINFFWLVICSLFLGLGYAVTFALFPVLIASRSGVKYLGMNYGMVFSAFGLGAVTSLIGSWLLDRTGSFTPAFIIAGGTTFIGLFLLILLHKKFSFA
jgi:MFS transporter, OFA family, oxalate/formate antiporter